MASAWKRKADRKDHTKPWQIKYRGADGKWKYAPGFLDKRETERMAAKLEDEADKRRRGLVDDRAERIAAERKRPLAEHLSDYAAFLKSKGGTRAHAERMVRIVEAAAAGKWGTAEDLDLTSATARLNALSAKGCGPRTLNWHRAGLAAFSAWLVANHRLAADPFAGLPRRNEEADQRRLRRALSDAELALLLAEAERSGTVLIPKRRKVNEVVVEGMARVCLPDRAWLYRVAMQTGLRRNELRSLTPRSFDFDGTPTVSVAAAYSKRRRRDSLPLRPDFAAMLADWLRDKPKDAPLWPGANRTSDVMRSDLSAARRRWIDDAPTPAERAERERSDFLRPKDSAGRFADFHALRHTFITRLARAGVAPKVAQALARHSTITLTMDRYAHVGLEDQTAALDALPAMDAPPVRPERQAATGTDGGAAEAPAAVARNTGATRAAANRGNDRQGRAIAGRIGGPDGTSANPGKPKGSGTIRHSEAIAGNTGPARIRTGDQAIMSRLLLPLSYRAAAQG